MELLDIKACTGVGTAENPCLLVAPDGFDFGEDVDPYTPPFLWCSGYFTLGITGRMGDVNVDGKINVTDIMLTVGYILGQENPAFHIQFADMNITVSDVMRIVNIILAIEN